MSEGLAFTLYAPLAAMGDLAVGEQRRGFDRPARSAILGLVAAALGLDRADEEGHAALDRGYRLAQRVRAAGSLLEDYHTVQAPPADRKARWTTRREALAVPDLETLLSLREYRSDPVIDIVLVRFTDQGPKVKTIAKALEKPTYTLFFGRKACPLGLPLRPVCFSALSSLENVFAALEEVQPEAASSLLSTLALSKRAAVYADADLLQWLKPNFEAVRVERRRDRVLNRRRWQFELRDEIVAVSQTEAVAI